MRSDCDSVMAAAEPTPSSSSSANAATATPVINNATFLPKTTFEVSGRAKAVVFVGDDRLVVETSTFCRWARKTISIPINEILAVKTGTLSTFKPRQFLASPFSSLFGRTSAPQLTTYEDPESAEEAINYKPVMEETDAQEQGDCLMVHFVHRDKACHHRWALNCLALRHHEREVLARWRVALNAHVRKYANDRPKNLLVFINPFGGVGASSTIFKKRVVPILDLLGITYEAIETERADHAHDLIIERPDLESKFDGIVCVGGDGIFNELFSGLLRRTAAQNRLDVNDLSTVLVRPTLRIGVIPGGSTDSVALAIHGTDDVDTATLHIVLGDRRCIDAASVFTEGNLHRFSMTMASYGYFGDLINRSEKYRWLGPTRYDVSGKHTFLLNRFYEGVVTYEKDATQLSDPSLRVPCTAQCPVCGPDAGQGCHEEQGETIKAEVRGTFMVVTGCHTTCCSRHSRKGVSPGTHLGDGNTDLILVRKTGRFNYFRYLYRTGYQRSNPFELPFVEVHRVRQFTFSHAGDCCSDENDNGGAGGQALQRSASANCKLSVWNVDGEILPASNITVKVHKQIVPVFCRGPEEPVVSFKNEIKPVDSGFEGDIVEVVAGGDNARLL